MSDTKGTEQLVIGTVVEYKKMCHIQPGEYVQVNQEDEPRKTIDINQTVGVILP